MHQVDIFISTSLRGPSKGDGKSMYTMKTTLASGRLHESRPQIAEYNEVTESRLVLLSMRDAMQRLRMPCELRIFTECHTVEPAINNSWYREWAKNGWVNSKGKSIANADIWQDIVKMLEDDGHSLAAVVGKHEFSAWMQWKMPVTFSLRNAFREVPEE